MRLDVRNGRCILKLDTNVVKLAIEAAKEGEDQLSIPDRIAELGEVSIVSRRRQ